MPLAGCIGPNEVPGERRAKQGSKVGVAFHAVGAAAVNVEVGGIDAIRRSQCQAEPLSGNLAVTPDGGRCYGVELAELLQQAMSHNRHVLCFGNV